MRIIWEENVFDFHRRRFMPGKARKNKNERITIRVELVIQRDFCFLWKKSLSFYTPAKREKENEDMPFLLQKQLN